MLFLTSMVIRLSCNHSGWADSEWPQYHGKYLARLVRPVGAIVVLLHLGDLRSSKAI